MTAVSEDSFSPRTWIGDAPLGAAAADSAVAPLVCVSVHPSSSPQSIADEMSARVASLVVGSTNVGVALDISCIDPLINIPKDCEQGGALQLPIDRGVSRTAAIRVQAGRRMATFSV